MTDWLTARPIAHRGLHGGAIVENTAAAVQAAVDAGYGIEVDLQISSDGEAFVHHDDAFGRLAGESGALRELTTAQIKSKRYRHDGSTVLTLAELLGLIAGRSALVLELKSRFDGDLRLPSRVAELLAGYSGAAAVMSFDPALIAALRGIAPDIRRGIVAERHYSHSEWAALTPLQKQTLPWLLHVPSSQPQFLAYSVRDLPAAAPLIARNVFGLPLLTWTVRSDKDRAIAAHNADQMIFEGFRP